MIALHELTKRYRNRAVVDRLSFVVEDGAIFGLLGPNGAGKTTTLAMLLHLVRPDGGSVAIDGVDVWREPARALRMVGALIEAPAFYPYLSAADNLRIVADYAGLPAEDLGRCLELVDLQGVGKQTVETFSQGMKQRLALAAALLGRPKVLVLDEPTVGIDPRGVVELRDLLRRLSADGCTIIFSSHQLAEVQHVCDQVAVLNHGRCVAYGQVKELLGASGRLLLRIGGDAADAERALALARAWRGGTKARVIEGMLDVLAPAAAAADLNRHLVEQGIAVAELRLDAPSLEDFFLRLTTEEPPHEPSRS